MNLDFVNSKIKKCKKDSQINAGNAHKRNAKCLEIQNSIFPCQAAQVQMYKEKNNGPHCTFFQSDVRNSLKSSQLSLKPCLSYIDTH